MNRPSFLSLRTATVAFCVVLIFWVVVRRTRHTRSISFTETLDAPSARRIESPPLPQGNAGRPATPVTNESLQGFLREDEKKMGIRRILAKGQSAEGDQFSPEQPALSKKQHAAKMAQTRSEMNEMSSAISRIIEGRQRPTIALNDKSTPALLDKTAPPVAPAAKAPGAPLEPASAPALSSARGLAAAPIAADEGAKEAATANDALQNIDSGFVARSLEDLKSLWGNLQTAQAAPAVDFSGQILVALIAGKKPGAGIKILRVEGAQDRMIVHYRQVSLGNGGLHYDFRTLPRTGLPFIFQKEP